MSKKLKLLKAKLDAIKFREKEMRKANKKAAKIRQNLTDYWCASFNIESCRKHVITLMFNRLLWIDMAHMCELMDVCGRRMAGENQYVAYRYMCGILKKELSKMGIDFAVENRRIDGDL